MNLKPFVFKARQLFKKELPNIDSKTANKAAISFWGKDKKKKSTPSDVIALFKKECHFTNSCFYSIIRL